ncbi:hypothetical protein NP493_215g00029 [Ridgeia piscesae]|uniref:Uncharacterized protein n=1 Tax=Ridgeia piscesae TaxID=27915 RepID=A0AAD9UE10_RIDPI|nr:hypothetical protein NP493_215g00029 [Ridgeia piscesae]
MRSSSSTREPLVLVRRYKRLSSSSFIFCLLAWTSSISLARSLSNSYFSVRMTRPNNWSSSPFIVTVKSMMTVRAEISGVYAGFGSFVVMYNVKPFITSISLSPTFTLYDRPSLMKFFSRMLSRAGSRSSPTSSMRRGRPSERASSRCWRKYLWFRFVS